MQNIVVASREIKKAITILKNCQKALSKLDPDVFNSWGIDGFCEQLDDDMYDLAEELNVVRAVDEE